MHSLFAFIDWEKLQLVLVCAITMRWRLLQIGKPHHFTSMQTASLSFECCSFKKKIKKKTCHILKGPLWIMPLLIWMSLYPSWQLGYHVSCCSIWSDFGSGSDCLSHPPQISVDPNVWVLKSTTCFLMRCQGDTLQEQRTGGRQPWPRCRGESLLLHWFFFFFSLGFLQKQMLRERENTSMFFCFFYTCMLWGKIMKYRERVSPLWLRRGSLQESILFNLTFMAASEW